jgi:hypothetical protein
MVMRVEFYKSDGGRLCGWVATLPHRRSFQGTTMAAGRDLPHDLTQFTIERALDIRDGFWGLLAHGGSFASYESGCPMHSVVACADPVYCSRSAYFADAGKAGSLPMSRASC